MEPMLRGSNGFYYNQTNSSPWCFGNLETPTTSPERENVKPVITAQSPQPVCKSLGGEAWEVAAERGQECGVPGMAYCPTTAALEFICEFCGEKFTHQSLIITHKQTHSNEVAQEGTANRKLYGMNTAAQDESHTNIEVFTCEICNAKFTHLSLLVSHKQTHSNEVSQEMTVNKKLYGPNTTVQDESHTNIKVFTCEICNVKFKYSSLLVSHKRIHSNEKPFTCEICNEKFTDVNTLKSHTRIHNSDRLFTCEVCNRNFADARNLISHKRIHTGERPYDCDLCNLKFTDIRNLKSHKLVHSGEKPFTCEICNAKFTKISNLKSHKLIHTGDRPFNCDLCGAKFTKYINLKTHMRVHTGERPFECEICNAKFAAAGNLKRHKETHTGEKSFICIVCSKWFSRARDLKRHALLHIGKRV